MQPSYFYSEETDEDRFVENLIEVLDTQFPSFLDECATMAHDVTDLDSELYQADPALIRAVFIGWLAQQKEFNT